MPFTAEKQNIRQKKYHNKFNKDLKKRTSETTNEIERRENLKVPRRWKRYLQLQGLGRVYGGNNVLRSGQS